MSTDRVGWSDGFNRAFTTGFGVQPSGSTIVSKALKKHRAICAGDQCYEVQCDRGELWRVAHNFRVIVVDGLPKLRQDRSEHEAAQRGMVSTGSGQPQTPGQTGQEEQAEERAPVHVPALSPGHRTVGAEDEADGAEGSDATAEAGDSDRPAPRTAAQGSERLRARTGPSKEPSRETDRKTGQSTTLPVMVHGVRQVDRAGVATGDGAQVEAFTTPVKKRAGRKRVYANATERKRAERARKRRR